MSSKLGNLTSIDNKLSAVHGKQNKKNNSVETQYFASLYLRLYNGSINYRTLLRPISALISSGGCGLKGSVSKFRPLFLR